jgi:hypothetical protein
MNETKLKTTVEKAIALDRHIRDEQQQLKEIKRLLVKEAQSRPDELVPTDGGGSSIRFVDWNGCAANVAFPAPTLKSTIDGVGKTIEKIMEAAGSNFYGLFDETPAWKPKAAFRDLAAELLGRGAGKLIRLCQTESQPRVSFETKDAEAAEAD